MGNQASRILGGSHLLGLLNIGKTLIHKVFNKSDSSFTVAGLATKSSGRWGKMARRREH
jgi:hypothetical protein